MHACGWRNDGMSRHLLLQKLINGIVKGTGEQSVG